MLSRLPWTPKPSGKKLRDRGAAARRETMTAAVVGILDCGRSSRFEYEAACRHGLRSGLCLEGESWARADAFAAAIVSEALRRLGAERPSWFQGQPEYADTDTSRGWCALPGCEKPIPIDRPETGGNAVKYCSHFCAKNASAQRQREHGARMDLASYLASCAARREATLQASAKECAHCGRHFLSKATNAKAYCSRACAYAARTQFSRRMRELRKGFQAETDGAWKGDAVLFGCLCCFGANEGKANAELRTLRRDLCASRSFGEKALLQCCMQERCTNGCKTRWTQET